MDLRCDRSGEWELVASGEKETPIQRYQRLKCEMKELVEEISVIKVIWLLVFKILYRDWIQNYLFCYLIISNLDIFA